MKGDDRLLDRLYAEDGEAPSPDDLSPEEREQLTAWSEVRARVREADDAEGLRPAFRARLRETVQAEARAPRGWARVRRWLGGPGTMWASAAAVAAGVALVVSRPDVPAPVESMPAAEPDPARVGAPGSATAEPQGTEPSKLPAARSEDDAPEDRSARPARRARAAAPEPRPGPSVRDDGAARAPSTPGDPGAREASRRPGLALREKPVSGGAGGGETQGVVADGASGAGDQNRKSARPARGAEGEADFSARRSLGAAELDRDEPPEALAEESSSPGGARDAPSGANLSTPLEPRAAPAPPKTADRLAEPLRAAEQAVAARRWAEAERALDRAAALVATATDRRRVWRARAEAELARGRPARAERWARRALEGADPEGRARAQDLIRRARQVGLSLPQDTPSSTETGTPATIPGSASD